MCTSPNEESKTLIERSFDFVKNYTHAGVAEPWGLTLSAPRKQHDKCAGSPRYVLVRGREEQKALE